MYRMFSVRSVMGLDETILLSMSTLFTYQIGVVTAYLMKQITKIWSSILLGFVISFVCIPANAQSTAKELFIGLDGGSSQLGGTAKTTTHAKPSKPRVLGLQTTIYQLFDDGGVKAVSPSTVFVGGSRIRFGFNANRSGFLYMVNLGSSGKVTTIFPSAVTDNNQVQPGLTYQIPQQTGKSIRFDTTPGEEVILVVLTETRISDFEFGGQIIALSSPGRTPNVVAQPDRQQLVQVASLDMASTSKDLFVEDDGVFQTVVFNPATDAGKGKKPLVTVLKLAHK